MSVNELIGIGEILLTFLGGATLNGVEGRGEKKKSQEKRRERERERDAQTMDGRQKKKKKKRGGEGGRRHEKDKKDISRWGNRTPGCRETFG